MTHALILLGLAAPIGDARADGARNVALHRPYTLSPAPNYSLTTDVGDSTQLTDGRRVTGGTLWMSREAVGWQGARPVTITIDLGQAMPIDAVSFSTAAGRAGVQWPAGILLATSVDGQRYADLGDLIVRDRVAHGPPPAAGYATHVFRADGLNVFARYVRLLVDPQGPYVFADEVEVLGPGGATAQRPLETIADPEGYFFSAWVPARVLAEGRRQELARAKLRLARSPAAPDDIARISRRLESLARNFDSLSVEAWRGIRPTAPISDAHEALFASLGELDAAEGRVRLAAWSASTWDDLSPDDAAPSRAGSVAVLAMRGERRSAAFNLRNQTAGPLEVRLRAMVDGIVQPRQLELGRVLWTVAANGRLVASAIEPVTLEPRGAGLRLPAGMTTQVWLTVTSEGWRDGLHTGTVEILEHETPIGRLALTIEQLPLRFPEHPALAISGWDYSDATGQYGLTAANVDGFIALLRRSGAVLPWATSAVLPSGRFDAAGNWLERPPTAALEAWLARWRGAARYRVFVGAGATLGGIPSGSPAFRAAVTNWAVYWAEQFRRESIEPSRVDLLLVDEPEGPARTERTLVWAEPLRAAGAGFRIWTNPIYPNADSIPAELIAAADTLCVDRQALGTPARGYERWLADLRASGRSTEIYATAGPAHLLDPYSYYRLQAWRAVAVGASVSSFWSFADTGGAPSDREYAAPRVPHTPLFITNERVLDSKHMEAILEGVNDAEYLHLLAERIERSGTAPADSRAEHASLVLQRALAAVLQQDDSGQRWVDGKRDSGLADAQRRELARALMELTGAQDRP